MTNFEKMKPALDMIFDDLDIDEFVTFLGEAYSFACCSFCKLEKRCNHMMGYDDPDHEEKYPFGNGVSCEDVLRSFLEEEVEE